MNNEPITDIGIKIKRWRSFKDYKQEVFAREIGISRIMLSRYENGRSKVSIPQLEKIAFLLNVDLAVFLKND